MSPPSLRAIQSRHDVIVDSKRPGTIEVAADGSCILRQERGFFATCFIPKILSIPSSDIVGITYPNSTDKKTIQIIYCKLNAPPSIKNNKPTRSLCKSPLLTLATHQSAASMHSYILHKCCHKPYLKICCIINPTSGPGKAIKTFYSQIEPIFLAAGCHLTIHVTTAPGHATSIARALQPGEIDVLAGIGGDGTVHEILQGMFNRPDWSQMCKDTAIVQVPCGSGNALAASTGLWNSVAAAHAVVKGSTSPLDIASVIHPQQHHHHDRCSEGKKAHSSSNGNITNNSHSHKNNKNNIYTNMNEEKRLYSFLSVTYGMIPCLDLGTEHMRWMGGARFTVGALQQIMRKKSYGLQVAFVAAGSNDYNGSSSSSSSSGNGGGNGTSSKSTSPAKAATTTSTGNGPPLKYASDFKKMEKNLTNLPQHHNWQWMPETSIQLLALCNLPWLDTNFNLAPAARLNNGQLHLVYSEVKSRIQSLKILTAVESGGHMKYMKERRVMALAIRPLAPRGETYVVVDGEEAEYGLTFVEVHGSLCNTFIAP